MNMATPTPTITILFLDTDPQSLVASVIAAQPSATTYLVNCPSDVSSNECGTFNETITVQPVSVPSPTYDAFQFDPDYPSDTASGLSFHCAMTSSSGSAIPTSCDQPFGRSPQTYTGASLDGLWQYLPVAVTAGADKLSGMTASVSATPTAAATTTTSDAVFAITGTVTPSSSATSLASSSAAPQSTGAAVAVGGFDTGVGGVALLGLLLGTLFA